MQADGAAFNRGCLRAAPVDTDIILPFPVGVNDAALTFMRTCDKLKIRNTDERLVSAMKKIKESSIPIYGVGLTWILRALLGKLHSFGQVIGCAAISAVVYFILKLFFPNKEMTDEEIAAEEQAAAKNAAKKKQKPIIDAEIVKDEPKQEPKQEPKPASTGNPELDEVLKKGSDSITRIRELNDAIPDYKVSAQIKQIEILTDKIFAHVKVHPENLRQIRQFLNYYLPTTIKLLEQYTELQDQGVRVGKIDEGMSKIEDMLDKVALAFQKQLESLFESTVVDITADIQVMENMMASEGLTE